MTSREPDHPPIWLPLWQVGLGALLMPTLFVFAIVASVPHVMGADKLPLLGGLWLIVFVGTLVSLLAQRRKAANK